MKNLMTKPFYDLGILVLRIISGSIMFFAHGLGKITSFSDMLHNFADPFGLGTEITFIVAVLAEGICSILIVLGLFTRLAVLPLIITMLTAAAIVHANDPFNVAELPYLYAAIFFTILITGPGRYSIDASLYGRGKRK